MKVYVVLDRWEKFLYTDPELYIVAVYLDKAKAKVRAESGRNLRVVEREVID